METRALRPEDLREGFESGSPEIDEYFRRYAGQNQWRHHVGVTYCLFHEKCIAGFVTLSAGDVDSRKLARAGEGALPRYDMPVLRLSRLGVSRALQRTGIGRELLAAAASIALEMRARVGCAGIVVDSKPEAVGFYQKYGFRTIPVTSRMAGAGARPVRLFINVRLLLHGAAAARDGLTAADSLAAEVRRRAGELGLSAEDVRSAVDRLLGQDLI